MITEISLLLGNKGEPDAAEALFRRALETQKCVLGPDHPGTLKIAHNLAALLSRKRALADAAALLGHPPPP